MTLEKRVYVAPMLESHKSYALLTGVSLPIGTSNFTNPLETDFLTQMDFMEGEQ